MVARGEVWWADLGSPRGSAPAYGRPVLVISADDFNRSRIRTVLAAILTSALQLGRAPGNVTIPKGTAGLDRDSVVNVTQLVTVDKDDLNQRLGILPDHFLDLVDAGLRLALDL